MAGLVEIQTERDMPLETCQQTRLVVINKIVNVTIANSRANYRRSENRFPHCVSNAVPA